MIHTLDLHFQVPNSIAVYVIETEAGPVLIETGPHSRFAHLEAELEKIGYKPADFKHVFVTHIHFDHAGAAWAFAEQGATIYVHPRGWKHMHDPERLYNSAKRIYGDMMEPLWGIMKAIPEELLIAVEDEQEIKVGEKVFKSWHTPGHANHHIAWQMDDVIFTGDVGGCRIPNGPVVPPCPPPDINLEAWADSILTLRAQNPSSLYLTHFGKVENPAEHLDQLEFILNDWAQWIKAAWEKGQSQKDMMPGFIAHTDEQLRQAGVLDKVELKKYEAANPAYMSVVGLIRYWQKKSEGSL
ncbi:MAG: MBL fold metallo-hydrolase [Bacteroidota bacterium]